MFAYRTPGVIFEWNDSRVRGITPLRTDIAAFVGIAERGPLHQPMRVESWTQYTSLFGAHLPQSFLAYAVDGFFRNGGRTCYVVRVADPTRAHPARLTLYNRAGWPVIDLVAANRQLKDLDRRDRSSRRPLTTPDPRANNESEQLDMSPLWWADPGVWGERVTVEVLPIGLDRFSLLVRLDGGAPEIWTNLSVLPSDERYFPRVINNERSGSRLVQAIDARAQTERELPADQRTSKRLAAEVPDAAAPNLRGGRGRLSGGQDGLAPSADLSALVDGNRRPRFRVVARLPLSGITVMVAAQEGGRVSLTVRAPGEPHEVFSDLSVNTPYAADWMQLENRYLPAVINDPRSGSRLISVRDMLAEADGTARSDLTPLPGSTTLSGGLDEQYLSGADAPPAAWGLDTLRTVDEVSIVAMPDIMPSPYTPPQHRVVKPNCDDLDAAPTPPQLIDRPPEFPLPFDAQAIERLQQRLIAHCELLRDRVAIIDPRADDTTPEQVIGWRGRFASSYAMLYYPWLMAPDPLRPQDLRAVPPCGHVAGVFARVDLRSGVHTPPANEELLDVQDTALAYSLSRRDLPPNLRQPPELQVVGAIDDLVHARLNDHSVNAIRISPGRGVRIAGARLLTVDGDVRYVNVRRLLLMIAEAIEVRAQWTVFEPNSNELWRTLDRVVRGFLDSLWRAGMLDGATAAEAYSVRCDAATNPPEVRDAGRVICEIGVLPPWPAEFVIVRIGRSESGSTLIEESEH